MSKQDEHEDQERKGNPIDAPVEAGAELDLLVASMEGSLDQLVDAILGRVSETGPGWMLGNTFLWEEIEEFARLSIRTQLGGLRRGRLPDTCPKVDATAAEATAKIGELKALLNAYRVSQMTLWEHWLDLVERGTAANTERRNDLLRHGSEYFFRYAGLLSDYVTDIYQQEVERGARSGEQRRFHAIRDFLEGKPMVDSPPDLDLERYHLGFVAWGEGGKQLARDLAAALGRPLLIYNVLNQSWWGWLSGSRQLTPVEERSLLDAEAPEHAGIAFGLEGFGESGFTATNRQALRARRVARKTERRVVRYVDVAVEALASENRTDARAFVARELRGIEADDKASRERRETIAAYFAAEHNAASAAATLGIHQQTVANRLRAAEEQLGHPVGARRVELELALRLRACLDRDAP
jgi:hypothetical protein